MLLPWTDFRNSARFLAGVPSPAQVGHYGEIVVRHSAARRIAALTGTAADRIAAFADPYDLADELQSQLAAIDKVRTTLLFTNTRAQAELWYRALVETRLDWLTTVSLHHGSVLQSGKRLSGSSAIQLEAQLDGSTPRDTRLSKSAHSSHANQQPIDSGVPTLWRLRYTVEVLAPRE